MWISDIDIIPWVFVSTSRKKSVKKIISKRKFWKKWEKSGGGWKIQNNRKRLEWNTYKHEVIRTTDIKYKDSEALPLVASNVPFWFS